MKPDIYKVELIGSGFLAVMARPVAGEWIDDEFKAIANEGICKVVSLLEYHEAFEVGLKHEKDYVQKHAIRDAQLLNLNQCLKKQSRLAKQFTQEAAYRMSQQFADKAVSQMPNVAGTDFFDMETFGQLPDDGLH